MLATGGVSTRTFKDTGAESPLPSLQVKVTVKTPAFAKLTLLGDKSLLSVAPPPKSQAKAPLLSLQLPVKDNALPTAMVVSPAGETMLAVGATGAPPVLPLEEVLPEDVPAVLPPDDALVPAVPPPEAFPVLPVEALPVLPPVVVWVVPQAQTHRETKMAHRMVVICASTPAAVNAQAARRTYTEK
jgi:hypothetical protein